MCEWKGGHLQDVVYHTCNESFMLLIIMGKCLEGDELQLWNRKHVGTLLNPGLFIEHTKILLKLCCSVVWKRDWKFYIYIILRSDRINQACKLPPAHVNKFCLSKKMAFLDRFRKSEEFLNLTFYCLVLKLHIIYGVIAHVGRPSKEARRIVRCEIAIHFIMVPSKQWRISPENSTKCFLK